jgi:hypothetical protein
MAERPSPWCPTDCNFVGVPKMCTTDCTHRSDKVFKTPQAINVNTGGRREDLTVIGRNGDYLYLSNGTSINVNNPTIRD